MFKWFCRLVFRFNGWKVGQLPPQDLKKFVLIGAPHTSNWDFIYAIAAFEYLKLHNPRFTIKREWMRFPFDFILGPLGAVPINRSEKKVGENRPKMVDVMAAYIKTSDEVTMLVTPEGTRSSVKRWKTGFYHVALQAEVPILLGYLDYGKRELGIGKIIYPKGNLEQDLREIIDFYNTITPCRPENYLKL